MSNPISLTAIILMLVFGTVANALERVDPMRPEDFATAAKDGQTTKSTPKKPVAISYWVQSIQIGDGQRSTTINGKLLRIGDKIRGAQLVSIEPHQVQLRRAGKLIKLKFLPRTIKR